MEYKYGDIVSVTHIAYGMVYTHYQKDIAVGKRLLIYKMPRNLAKNSRVLVVKQLESPKLYIVAGKTYRATGNYAGFNVDGYRDLIDQTYHLVYVLIETRKDNRYTKPVVTPERYMELVNLGAYRERELLLCEP